MESKEKDTTVREVCQFCANYGRCSKKCGISGEYVARKNPCNTGKFQKK